MPSFSAGGSSGFGVVSFVGVFASPSPSCVGVLSDVDRESPSGGGVAAFDEGWDRNGSGVSTMGLPFATAASRAVSLAARATSFRRMFTSRSWMGTSSGDRTANESCNRCSTISTSDGRFNTTVVRSATYTTYHIRSVVAQVVLSSPWGACRSQHRSARSRWIRVVSGLFLCISCLRGGPQDY